MDGLRKRNVYRSAISYAIFSWLILQVVTVVNPILNGPMWIPRFILFFLLAGFPLMLILSWTRDENQKPQSISGIGEEDSNVEEYTRKNPLTSNAVIGFLLLIILVQFIYNRIQSRSDQLPDSTEMVLDGNYVENRTDNLLTLAALPFSNISESKDHEFLGFAMVDQVISSLSYLQNIVVRPSSSIRKYSKSIQDPKEIADELSVQFVLMGHYLTEKNAIRLNLELVDVNNNTIRWQGSIREEMEDIFKLQDIVAQKVIDGLKVQFSDDERNRMTKSKPDSPLAYEYFLKGISEPSNVEGNRIAIGYLQKALELDSTFAPIYAEIGNRFQHTANFTILEKRSTEIDRALVYLGKAVELNNEDLAALMHLSSILNEINQKERALDIARKILRINPNSEFGHFSLGYIYRYTGMIEEAVSEMEIAVSIDPKTDKYRSIGITYSIAGRYDKAISSLYYEDGSGFCESWKGLTYIRMKELEKAVRELEKAIQIDSSGILGYWSRGMLYRIKGQVWEPEFRAKAVEITSSFEDPESIFNYGLIFLMNEDISFFLECYEKAVDKGYFPYPAFEIDPVLDVIRDHPEFVRITRKAKIKHEEFLEKHEIIFYE